MEKVAVIGIGRLGLCLALNLERAGYSVLGIDKRQDYVASLNCKAFESPEPYVSEYLAHTKNFKASSNFNEIFNSHYAIIFLVVPTPSLADGQFDHSFIDNVIDQLASFGKQRERRTLVISSTCSPGYCDSIEKKLAQLNYSLIYNPEFIAQGSIIQNQLSPDQVLIGETNTIAGDKVKNIYLTMCENSPVFCRMSLISAEITKLATNCFLTAKISFANAVGDLALKAGGEPEKILEAIGADKRIGGNYLKYGFGYGGPCFPRDNRAFVQFAKNNHYEMEISKAADLANEIHADFLFQHWLEKHEKDDFVIFESVTYKKGTDIIEESQQLKLALSLVKAGKKVKIKESAAVITSLQEIYGSLFTYQIND